MPPRSAPRLERHAEHFFQGRVAEERLGEAVLTAWIYSQGAPGVFKGDLHYYNVDHDLAGLAATIDTTATPLYVLTGEYDWSSTPAMGQALAAAVPGATFRVMADLGHFPMCENPARFREHILPVLDEIRARHSAR